ncbi:hypothetical protein CRM90_28430 [Mycobacterium sp. ENV421]|uniref:hypothetical protein n=1 Tax=Mycobacterium sp. ENV421 TaxID=1213407 RepID=UPI000C99AD42|nr:hypothetical protein [Mycobacterium sp. ENV421]PND54342.1 hypothetical protein CRM90_28430 [Mycobacterium sp. ENV421]
MAQVPGTADLRVTALYPWLADREQRAVAAGGALADPTTGTSYDGSRERLAALRRGDCVDFQLGSLPPWARVGEPLRWWRRATVSADGSMQLRDDDSAWIVEHGLSMT